MDCKKIITISLLIFIMLTISTVAANENENNTLSNTEILTDGELSNASTNIELKNSNNDAELISASLDMADEEPLQMDGTFYNEDEMEDEFGFSINIIAKNTSTYYKSNDKISVKFVNISSNEPLSDYYVEVELREYYDEWDCSVDYFDGYTNSEGVFKVSLKNLHHGRYYLTSYIMLDPEEEVGHYCEDHAFIEINKAPVTLTTKKLKGTTKSSLLTAFVKDQSGKNINEGYVKFTINGKTYKAYVKKGIATKTVKLSKAKTYKYTAKFYSNNYKTKTSSSKIVVKKAKKWYTFKVGKYKCKISHKQYMKLINAKNSNKDTFIEVKTGKYYTYKKPVYKTVKTKKTKWVYKKVLSFKSVSNADWSDTTYYDYDLDKYFNKGWEIYGWTDTESNDGHIYKSYAKLKKKVKYTVTKKVKTGYKKAKSPIYIYLETLPKDGLIKKGDYIEAWTDGGKEMGIILSLKKTSF